MNLQETITQHLHQAMKDKDSLKTNLLRLVNAAILDAQVKATIDGTRKDMTDEDIIAIVDSLIKRGQESSRLYREAGDTARAQAEEKEIAILQKFLPERLDEQATQKAASDIIASLNATSMRDMGKVMGQLQKQYGASLDKALTAQVVKKLLSGG